MALKAMNVSVSRIALRPPTGARRGLSARQRRCLLLLVLVLGGVESGVAGAAVPAATDVVSVAVPAATDVVSVAATPARPPIPADYLGLSLEYNTVSAYEGVSPRGANAALAQLIRNLAPGGTPVIRIGGDSTDWTWWPIVSMKRPPGVDNELTPRWAAKAQTLARSAGARLVLGLNLEAGSALLASVEAKRLLAAVGHKLIDAFEVGNEPQLYPLLPWYRLPDGTPQVGRPLGYNLADYAKEFTAVAHAVPHVPLAGPAVGRSWVNQIGPFITSAPGLRIVTFHAYAINRYGAAFRGRNCSTAASDPSHPTVSTLLAPFASEGLTRDLPPLVALAHRRGLRFRIDELNAITCAGTPGVSDTFASALWVLNALFAIADAGIDGVNVHTWRGSAGKLFGFSQTRGRWSASVRPEYYGLLMFRRAAPAGSRLLATSQTDATGVDSWATIGADHATRVLLINDSLTMARSVLVHLPHPTAARASLAWLRAPRATATSGITLGCQSFAAQTLTGKLAGPMCIRSIRPVLGSYSVQLPAATAVLVTVPR
jgi:hypothetical protein